MIDRETVLKLAKEVWGEMSASEYIVQHERFANLIAAKQREIDARIVGKNADRCQDGIMREVLLSNATAIRGQV